MAPSDEYFLSLDADGVGVSSDFYLRLTGAITGMLRDEDPSAEEVPEEVPVPPRPTGPPAQALTELEAVVVVTHGHRGILGGEPDVEILLTEARRLSEGWSVRELCESLVSRGDTSGVGPAPTAEELAWRLYRGILERDPDPGGLAETLQWIESGRLAERAAQMLGSRELHRRFLWDV